MSDPPAQGLLQVAHRALVEYVLPGTHGAVRYQALMIARALAIAARQAELGPDAERQEVLGIGPLIPESSKVALAEGDDMARLLDGYRRNLCREIRNGRFDAPGAGREALLTHLSLTTEHRLRINNPKALGGQA